MGCQRQNERHPGLFCAILTLALYPLRQLSQNSRRAAVYKHSKERSGLIKLSLPVELMRRLQIQGSGK
jgi:hypothetical protein